MVSFDVDKEAFAGVIVCADIAEYMDELTKTLFAVKMAHSNPTKIAGCVNHLLWEFLIKAEFGEGCIYDWFVNVGKYLFWNSACGEGIRDGW